MCVCARARVCVLFVMQEDHKSDPKEVEALKEQVSRALDELLAVGNRSKMAS